MVIVNKNHNTLFVQRFSFCSGPEGYLDTVYFNLHFNADPDTRIFAQEIKETLGQSLNTSQVLPDIDLASLEVTERKQERPGRKKVLTSHKMRRYRGDVTDNDIMSNGKS